MSFDKKNQLKNKDDEGKIYTTAKHIFCWLIVWSVSCRGETSLSCLYQGLIIWTFSDWNKKTNRSIGSKLFLSRSNFNPQGAPACHWVSRRFSSPRVHSLLGSSRVSSCSWSDGHVILLWVYYSKWVTLCFTAELRDVRTRTGRRGPRCSCGFKSLFFWILTFREVLMTPVTDWRRRNLGLHRQEAAGSVWRRWCCSVFFVFITWFFISLTADKVRQDFCNSY